MALQYRHCSCQGNYWHALRQGPGTRLPPQCFRRAGCAHTFSNAALTHLDHSWNQIGAGGAESLAGVLGQCAALAHLNLCGNGIGTVG